MSQVLVEIVDRPIDAARVRGFVAGEPTLGGIVLFEGVTRAERDVGHGALVRLDYEAHPTMARRQMELLAEQAIRDFGAGKVAVVHRIGGVKPAETSVMIGVACPHRAEAFDACRWIIDTLKKDVPIWKKDVFEEGFVRWVQPGVGSGG